MSIHFDVASAARGILRPKTQGNDSEEDDVDGELCGCRGDHSVAYSQKEAKSAIVRFNLSKISTGVRLMPKTIQTITKTSLYVPRTMHQDDTHSRG